MMKIILGAVILVLSLMAHYVLDYQARYAELEQLDQNLQSMQARLEEIQGKLRRLPELTEEMQRLEREVVWNARAGDDPDQLVNSYLTELERLVLAQHDDSFRIQSVSPGDPTAEGEESPVPGRKFQLKMQGRYQTLADFLVQLGRMKLDRLVTIDRIELSPTEGSVLNITLPMTAYLRG